MSKCGAWASVGWHYSSWWCSLSNWFFPTITEALNIHPSITAWHLPEGYKLGTSVGKCFPWYYSVPVCWTRLVWRICRSPRNQSSWPRAPCGCWWSSCQEKTCLLFPAWLLADCAKCLEQKTGQHKGWRPVLIEPHFDVQATDKRNSGYKCRLSEDAR